MSTPKKAVLEPLRVRLRRLQFTVGMGFLALVLGSMLSVALTLRLSERVQALDFAPLQYAIALLVENLWVLAVLPLLCYGSARIIELRPWPTALGTALTGQFFILALDFARDGVDGWLERGWLRTVLEWAVFAGGVVLSRQAVVRGRAHAHKQGERAQQQAAAKTDEYAEFLREAERAGEKIAQREAAKAEGQGTPEQSQPAPEQAPATPTLESSEPKPEDAPRKPAA
ncbi:hypothetical protein [Archangium lipolyticum]|uniref:hypothetical protein n=1 Tax=Archangium lipolyticum TaxID=2970465 RepID=UPI00214A0928|nr:hypothetical protein [Archangium lipolyticum]